jgi:hypothetical protein
MFLHLHKPAISIDRLERMGYQVTKPSQPAA